MNSVDSKEWVRGCRASAPRGTAHRLRACSGAVPRCAPCRCAVCAEPPLARSHRCILIATAKLQQRRTPLSAFVCSWQVNA